MYLVYFITIWEGIQAGVTCSNSLAVLVSMKGFHAAHTGVVFRLAQIYKTDVYV